MYETQTDMTRAVSFPICPGAVSTDMLNTSLKENDNKFPSEFVIKAVDESAEHVLVRIDEGIRECNVFVQWDGQVIPW
jgi:short-subunit dehydrogenase